jgi:hypothetical protein
LVFLVGQRHHHHQFHPEIIQEEEPKKIINKQLSMFGRERKPREQTDKQWLNQKKRTDAQRERDEEKRIMGGNDNGRN